MELDTEPDEGLDEELRRLFCDDRLDIAVRQGADLVIVAGARRVRRRRYLAITAGAVAVAVLVGGGIAVAANGQWSSLPPAQTSTLMATNPEATTSTTTTTTAPPPRPDGRPTGQTVVGTVTEGPRGNDGDAVDPPPVDPPPSLTDGVLTATGYGPFELGMSSADALATGLLTLEADGGDCLRYSINGGGRVLVSGQLGVTRVDVPARVRTPEGIGADNIVGEVGLTYPWAVEYRMGLTAGTTGDGAASTYQFVTVEPPPTTGPLPPEYVIGEVRLALAANDCALAF